MFGPLDRTRTCIKMLRRHRRIHFRSRRVGCPGESRTHFVAAYKTACNHRSRRDCCLVLPDGNDPPSPRLQLGANPPQLKKRGATHWIRTSTPCLLRAVRLPIAPGWLILDPRARFELAALGLGIPGPFHRPREIGPPPASRTLHAKIRSLCCTSGAREKFGAGSRYCPPF